MPEEMTAKESSSFERNWRRRFEKRMRPVADKLYWEIIPGLKDISRVYPTGLPLPLHVELGALDRELGIDVIFTLENGMRLTCQEKFAAPKFLPLQDVTVEYYNDPVRRLPGDWFNLACQLYFFGFASRDYRSFDLWILVDWTRTVWETSRGNISWEHMPNTRNGAMASFVRTFIASLPRPCVLVTNFSDAHQLRS
jgi:hypothetical protein